MFGLKFILTIFREKLLLIFFKKFLSFPQHRHLKDIRCFFTDNFVTDDVLLKKLPFPLSSTSSRKFVAIKPHSVPKMFFEGVFAQALLLVYGLNLHSQSN
jgi:hypothetical protein